MTFGIYLMLNVVLILFLALWLRRLILRRLEPERILGDLNSEIGQLIAELNQTGDHNVSVLEDRIMQLRDLVADADRQIDELSAVVDRVRSQRSSPEEPVYTVSFSGTAAGREDAPSDHHQPSGEYEAPGPLWESDSSHDEPESPAPDDARLEVLSPREQVHELHQQGLSSEIIAGKTGMAIGEVELIISLGSGRGGR